MKAGVRITAYDKRSERLIAAAALPPQVVDEARRIARVPASDPDLQGVYPLTPEQVAQITTRAGFALDVERYDYCLEAVAPKVAVHPHSGLPKTRKERAKLHAARAREKAASEGG